mgnify:CR=1 FL=1
MTQPLAFVVYENVLLGNQLVNRLHDLGYRVTVVSPAKNLVAKAEEERPLVVVADLAARKEDLCTLIRQLRQNPPTSHIPVLAFLGEADDKIETAAHSAGATLIALEKEMLSQMPRLLAQVLEVE